MSTESIKAGDLLDRVRAQAEHLGAQGDGLEKGYADLGWDLLEVAEMQYWRVNHDTFKDYLKLIGARAKMTVPMLQRYMLTVRDLSDSFSREQLELMGITKAMRLRAVKDFAIVLPRSVVEAALDPKITVAEMKKITSKELKLPEEEEVDWMDCEMEFSVTAEQRLTIEQAIKAAMHADPPTKLNISRPAQMLDVMMKLSMEFLQEQIPLSDLAWVEIGAAGLPVRIFKSFKAATHLVARRIAFSAAQMDRSQAVGIIRHTTFVRSLGDCELCGSPVNEKTGHMHEKLHRGQGGEISVENSIFICAKCHKRQHRNREPKFTRRNQ